MLSCYGRRGTTPLSHCTPPCTAALRASGSSPYCRRGRPPTHAMRACVRARASTCLCVCLCVHPCKHASARACIRPSVQESVSIHLRMDVLIRTCQSLSTNGQRKCAFSCGSVVTVTLHLPVQSGCSESSVVSRSSDQTCRRIDRGLRGTYNLRLGGFC